MRDYLRDKFCRWLCGGRKYDVSPPLGDSPPAVPTELREASHRMATAVANMQGAAHVIRREWDVVNDLVHAMQGNDKNG